MKKETMRGGFNWFPFLICAALYSFGDCQQCGQSKYPDAGENPAKWIVGGDDARPHEFPWMVTFESLQEDESWRHMFSGGSLLNERWVISAAHCFWWTQDNIRAVLGEHELEAPSTVRTYVDVELIVTHPNHTGNPESPNYQYDFALLKLAEAVNFTEDISPACLPEDLRDYEEVECVVSGWGALNSEPPIEFPSILQWTKKPILDNESCRVKFEEIERVVTDDMVCAGQIGENEVDACQGDSGGPLACKIDGSFHQVGVVSWGYRCATEWPGVYASLQNQKEWIEGVIGTMS